MCRVQAHGLTGGEGIQGSGTRMGGLAPESQP